MPGVVSIRPWWTLERPLETCVSHLEEQVDYSTSTSPQGWGVRRQSSGTNYTRPSVGNFLTEGCSSRVLAPTDPDLSPFQDGAKRMGQQSDKHLSVASSQINTSACSADGLQSHNIMKSPMLEPFCLAYLFSLRHVLPPQTLQRDTVRHTAANPFKATSWTRREN